MDSSSLLLLQQHRISEPYLNWPKFNPPSPREQVPFTHEENKIQRGQMSHPQKATQLRNRWIRAGKVVYIHCYVETQALKWKKKTVVFLSPFSSLFVFFLFIFLYHFFKRNDLVWVQYGDPLFKTLQLCKPCFLQQDCVSIYTKVMLIKRIKDVKRQAQVWKAEPWVWLSDHGLLQLSFKHYESARHKAVLQNHDGHSLFLGCGPKLQLSVQHSPGAGLQLSANWGFQPTWFSQLFLSHISATL